MVEHGTAVRIKKIAYKRWLQVNICGVRKCESISPRAEHSSEPMNTTQ